MGLFRSSLNIHLAKLSRIQQPALSFLRDTQTKPLQRLFPPCPRPTRFQPNIIQLEDRTIIITIPPRTQTTRWVNHGQRNPHLVPLMTAAINFVPSCAGGTGSRSRKIIQDTRNKKRVTNGRQLIQTGTPAMAQQPSPAQHDQGRAVRNWVRLQYAPRCIFVTGGAQLVCSDNAPRCIHVDFEALICQGY